MLRIGIVGGGAIGRLHARAVEQSGLAHVTLVTQRQGDEGERFAREVGARFVSEPSAIWSGGHVDAVIACTPTSAHLAALAAATQFRVPLLIEKPVVASRADMKVAARLAAHRPVITVGFSHRFAPGPASALRLALSGSLGRVVHADLTMIKGWHFRERQAWHRGTQAGGMWFNNGAHLVDLALRFTAGSRVRVSAAMRPAMHDQVSDDLATAVLDFPVSTTTIRLAGTPYESMTYHGVIVGTQKAVQFDLTSCVELGDALPVRKEDAPDWRAVAFSGQFAAFAAYLAGGYNPCSLDEALDVSRVLRAGAESSRRGSRFRPALLHSTSQNATLRYPEP